MGCDRVCDSIKASRLDGHGNQILSSNCAYIVAHPTQGVSTSYELPTFF